MPKRPYFKNLPSAPPTGQGFPIISYAFGSGMKERSQNFGRTYKYGFNNQEKEDELGEYYSFEYRVHDARIGRFLSVDPLAAKYPWNSTYAFAENRVIDGIELEGLEWQPVNGNGDNVDKNSKDIKGYKWAGYDLKTTFKHGDNGSSQQYYEGKAGTVEKASLTFGNYKYSWSSSSGTQTGKVEMNWLPGAQKNPDRPLDGQDITLDIKQGRDGTSTASYSTNRPGLMNGISQNAEAIMLAKGGPAGMNQWLETRSFDVTGMRASQIAEVINRTENQQVTGTLDYGPTGHALDAPLDYLTEGAGIVASFLITDGLIAATTEAAIGGVFGGAANGGSKYLYHYTSREAAGNILKTGLKITEKRPFIYTTNVGNLSPLQAQIELALSANKPLPNTILRIDASGLNPFMIRRVQGNLSGLGAGGGTEFMFNQNIPANLIKIVK